MIIFHVFCCSIMLAMRLGLHGSIFKIIAHALGCRESRVWIIFRIHLLFVGAHLDLFRKERQQLYIAIFWIAYCGHISWILLFNNACHEIGSACFNFKKYCSCSQLPWEHSMNTLPRLFVVCWCAPSSISQSTAAAVYCNILNCLLWPHFMDFAVQ